MEDGRRFRYPGMFDRIDPNLRSSDLILTDEERAAMQRRNEASRVGSSGSASVDTRGRQTLFRRLVNTLTLSQPDRSADLARYATSLKRIP